MKLVHGHLIRGPVWDSLHSFRCLQLVNEFLLVRLLLFSCGSRDLDGGKCFLSLFPLKFNLGGTCRA